MDLPTLLATMVSSPAAHTYPPLGQAAINLALSEMSLVEFEAWKNFTSPLPRSAIFTLENIRLEAPIDWNNITSIASPFNEDSIAIAMRRVKGLNYLYNTSKARLLHADWYAAEYAETWLPVVEAVGRVLTWETSLKNGYISQSVIADRTPEEEIPIPWKSYNITSVSMAVIPPFDPLALKHALIALCSSHGKPGPEHKAYHAFTAGTITASTLQRDCPIDWDTDFTKTKLSRNVNHTLVSKLGAKNKRVAEALSFLYQSEKVTQGHASWWGVRYMGTEGDKLVTAVMKICAMERAMDVRPAFW